MGIKRYIANIDNTITNAFKADGTRATGSNCGLADTAEVFSLYGVEYLSSSAATASIEKSRALFGFPVEDISTDRDNGHIPASGSVSFYLRLFNASTQYTTPRSASYSILAVKKPWVEGTGVDLDLHTDDDVSNWVAYSASSDGTEGRWEGQGGDFYTASADNNLLYSAFLQGGTEDIEVDISELVEQWIAGTKDNNGVVFKLSGAYEDGTKERSYFTKQVYTRGSQYFFKRPIIEARFDTATKDDSARFYISSSLLPAANNLNNLYLYNFFEGQLKDIPTIETSGLLQLSLYSASQQGAVAGDKLFLPAGGDVVTLGDVNATASHVSTGVYSVSFPYASSSITSVIPVWTTTGSVVFHTGSVIECKTYSPSDWYNNPEYKLSVVNLQDTYYTDERPTFRVFTQDKNRQVNIYTVAFADPPVTTITDLFYSITRAVDSKTVISYGTGSLEYTRLSYDNSGSFFALDMDLFEPGYAYVMSFVRKFGTSFTQLPQKFRFRVQERND